MIQTMPVLVEIPEGQAARLRELAARRGETCVSSIVQEAIDVYLQRATERRSPERLRAALASLGSLEDGAAEEMRATVRELRGRWILGKER